MTRRFRVLDTGLQTARHNIAMTSAMMEMHRMGRVPDTVRFHRYERCVLIGHSQTLHQVADSGYCASRGITQARRITGGGAVYMSPSMLAWDVIVDRGTYGRDLGALTNMISTAVAGALSQLGCEARFSPPNAIEIRGRKVSGSSGTCDGESALLQGTILVVDEVEDMAHALRLPVAHLRAAVVGLSEALGHRPSLEAIRDPVARSLGTALGSQLLHELPSVGELAHCTLLLAEGIGQVNDVSASDERARAAQ